MNCWLTTNRNCNMRCNWCYGQQLLGERDSVMTLAKLDQILFAISTTPISRFILIGGEPTVVSHLPAVIERLKGRISLVTNGIRLSEKSYLKSLLENGLSEVTLSVKGATNERYQANTGVACIEKIEQAIQNLNEIACPYSISITFSESLVVTLPELLRWMRLVGVRSMGINFCRPYVLNGKVVSEGVPSPRDMAAWTVSNYALIRESGINFSFNFMLPLCLLPEEFIEMLVERGQISTVCQLQQNSGFVFMPDGTLALCNHLFDYALGKVGVDFTSPVEFENFMKGGVVSELHRKTRNFPDERCQMCRLNSRCGGGCLVEYLRYNSSELIAGPFLERS